MHGMQGFVRLEAGLVPHARCGPMYGPLFALLLGRDTRAIPMGLAADAAALEEFLLVRTVLYCRGKGPVDHTPHHKDVMPCCSRRAGRRWFCMRLTS
jgi:hypothetical protein